MNNVSKGSWTGSTPNFAKVPVREPVKSENAVNPCRQCGHPLQTTQPNPICTVCARY